LFLYAIWEGDGALGGRGVVAGAAGVGVAGEEEEEEEGAGVPFATVDDDVVVVVVVVVVVEEEGLEEEETEGALNGLNSNNLAPVSRFHAVSEGPETANKKGMSARVRERARVWRRWPWRGIWKV
jgi:hypothetical protein